MKLCFLGSAECIHIQRWVKYFQNKAEISLITFSEYPLPGIKVYYIKPSSKSKCGKISFFFKNMLKVRSIVSEIKPDILHAFYLSSYGLFGALSGFQPLVVSALGTDVLIEPRESFLFRMITKYVLKKVNLVTSMAKHMSKGLINMGVSEGKIILLPFGVSLSEFNPDLRIHQQPKGHPIILSTRHLNPVYNVGLLIRAVPEVIKLVPDAEVILIGEGSQERELKMLAKNLGVANHIKFLGSVPHSDIPKHMASCDVLVSTAVSDGNNITLNEAMACGAFPIATDIPANREWLEDGVNGFLVPISSPSFLAQKIVDAIRNPELRKRAASINIEIVKQRAIWEKNMEALELCYKKLLQKN